MLAAPLARPLPFPTLWKNRCKWTASAAQPPKPRDPLGYCSSCGIETKLELMAGFRRLNTYLAVWAGSQDWLQQRATASGA
jgi:hypothetical protein